MRLCVWAMFRAPRALPALGSHAQPLGFLTLPTAQDPSASSPCPSDPTAAGSPAPPALPCPAMGPHLSPASACPGLGLPHPSLPAALLLAGAMRQSRDGTPCLDVLSEPLLGQQPAPGHCQPLSCPAAFSMGWWLSSSTSQAKLPGVSPVKFRRSPRCSNVT